MRLTRFEPVLSTYAFILYAQNLKDIMAYLKSFPGVDEALSRQALVLSSADTPDAARPLSLLVLTHDLGALEHLLHIIAEWPDERATPQLAKTCEDVLRALEEDVIDGLIVDEDLLEESKELLGLLARNFPWLAILVIARDEGSHAELFRAGVQDILNTRSINAAGLWRAVNHAIERKRFEHARGNEISTNRMRVMGEAMHRLIKETAFPLHTLNGDLIKMMRVWAERSERQGSAIMRPGEVELMSRVLARSQGLLGRAHALIKKLHMDRDHQLTTDAEPELNGLLRSTLYKLGAEPFKDIALSLKLSQRSLPVGAEPQAVEQAITQIILSALDDISQEQRSRYLITLSTYIEADRVCVLVERCIPGTMTGRRQSFLRTTSETPLSEVSPGLTYLSEILDPHQGEVRSLTPEANEEARLEISFPAARELDEYSTMPRGEHLSVLVLEESSMLAEMLLDRDEVSRITIAKTCDQAMHLLSHDMNFDGILFHTTEVMDSLESFLSKVDFYSAALTARVVATKTSAINEDAMRFLNYAGGELIPPPETKKDLDVAVNHWSN